MNRIAGTAVVTACILGGLVGVSAAQDPDGVAPPALPYVVDDYDPDRDPGADLQSAIQLATESRKRILLEVGGQWCGWCKLLDLFIHDHPAVHSLLVDHFLIVKVNYGRENENAEFLEQYPQIHGYPHIFVLESDGTFLHSQDTALLEDGRTYNEGALVKFLKMWMRPVS